MKKYLKLFASFALVAAIAVGFTLAYLQKPLETKTNTFTSSQKIDGTLTEPGWTNDFGEGGTWNDYLPNEAHAKDPKITITNDSVSAYVAIKVNFKDSANAKISYTKFTTDYAKVFTGGMLAMTAGTPGFNTTDWTDNTLDFAAKSADKDAMFFVYKTTIKGATTNPLFDYVKVNNDIVKGDQSLPTFKIDIAGYAVQADEVSAADALDALIEMAK